MKIKKEFEHYMLCGHGRCFSLLDNNKELFRDIVLYGCLNDISFDLQCESSRGLFMYNLALEYNDYDYFLKAVIQKFLSPEVNEDWHIINHLGDFVMLFAYDYGDKNAVKAMETKYQELYKLIMSLKWSSRANNILQCYEYTAILIMQNNDSKRTFKILEDIGRYFIRRRKASDNELKCSFEWFWTLAEEKFGENFITENSKEIRRFKKVMSYNKDFQKKIYPDITAGKYIEKAKSDEISRQNIIEISRADISEKLALAYAVESESNPDIKANLLKAFTIRRNKYPLNPETIIKYAESENKNLSAVAVEVLLYIKSDCIHDFALRLLNRNFSSEAVQLLINNYHKKDKSILIKSLDNIETDPDDKNGWHSIVLSITDEDNISSLPDEAVIFVYEKSMCSCCREYAVDELIRRNIFTDNIASECLMDCNCEIRSKAKSRIS